MKKDRPKEPMVVRSCEICGEPLEGLRSPYGDLKEKGSTICLLCFLQPKKRIASTVH